MPKLYIGNSPLAVGIVTNTEATATAEDIAEGKTAWANGAKLTGTGEMARELIGDMAEQDRLIAELTAALEGKGQATEIDLEEEVNEQDSAIEEQDELIAQIFNALENKLTE